MATVEILSDIRLPPHFCIICKLQIESDIDLRLHYYEEHQVNFFVDSSYAEEEILQVNESQGEQENKPQLQNKTKQRKRKVDGVPAKEKPHLCPICNKCYAQKSSRDRHVRELHEEPGKFGCDQCELRFSNQFNLRTHKKRIHSIEVVDKTSGALKCPHCCRLFKKQASLNNHIATKHKDKLKSAPTNATLLQSENEPQILAENVMEQLKLLQRAITDDKSEITAIDDAEVADVLIKDRLNPCGYVTEYKIQRIKRADGYKYYVCEFCSKEFRKSSGYLRHRRIHTKVRPYICVVCKKSFPTQNELKRHCSIHILDENEKLYKCPKCSEGFKTITTFDKHLSSHIPHCHITFNCKQCPKSFSSLKMYFDHNHNKVLVPEMDMLKSLLPSPLCVVEGEEMDYMVCEEKKQTNDFKCSICDMTQISLITLKQHEKRHNTLWKYQCQLCKRFYASRLSLSIHIRTHQSKRIFKCLECNKIFQRKYELTRHNVTQHSNSKRNYKCRYCQKLFKTKQYCRSHMMTHIQQLIQTNEANEQTETNVASIQTLVQNNPQREIIIKEIKIPKKPKKNAHAPEPVPKDKNDLSQRYSCLDCPQKFPYHAWLKKHMAEKHSKENPYTCEVCLKTFSKMQSLKRHRLTHQEEEVKNKSKVTCQVCGKLYSNKKSLNLHLRLHTEERPFKCEINLCEKSFRTSGHLIEHQKSNHK